MTLTIEYPFSGSIRVHRNLTQDQVNSTINLISDLNEREPVAVVITVEED